MFENILSLPLIGNMVNGVGQLVCWIASQPIEVTEKAKDLTRISLNILGFPC